MLQFVYKLSIVHNKSSDHAILFTSISNKLKKTYSVSTKIKFDLPAAVQKTRDFSGTLFTSGNELNDALENVVRECTTVLRSKSSHRIKKSHISRELILDIRERDRLYTLHRLHPNNDIIATQYNRISKRVNSNNESLKARYEQERMESAAGDARRTWKLYKEVIFNQFGGKTDETILINGVPTVNSVASCNEINEHFCNIHSFNSRVRHLRH